MIQRIQTIFLLIAAILMAVTVCSPLAILSDHTVFRCLGIYLEPAAPEKFTWGVLTMSLFGGLFSFLAIFFYKKRKLQMKLCTMSILFIILFYVAFGSYLSTGMTSLHLEFVRIQYGLILPLIAMVLIILAHTKIKADEKLIESLNRIR